MSTEQQQEAANLIGYHAAACDLHRAARDLLGASLRLLKGAQATDPDNVSDGDPIVATLMRETRDVLALAVQSSPGIRYLFEEVIAVTTPTKEEG